MISFVHWIIIGVIQGITEWIPVSSKTAILLYAMRVMGLDLPTAYFLSLLMQGSTALAGVVYLREDYLASVKAVLGHGLKDGASKATFLAISLVVTGAMGVPLMLFVEEGMVSGTSLLLLTAITFLIVACVDFSRKSLGRRVATSLTPLDSLVVGTLQGIAVLPGFSRSASTTLGLLFRGFRADESLRLSFLTGVLATVGATLVSLATAASGALLGVDAGGILIAWLTGAIVGILSVRTFVVLSAKLRVWQFSLVMAALTLTSLLLV